MTTIQQGLGFHGWNDFTHEVSSKREKDPAGCGHWIQDFSGDPGDLFFVTESPLSFLTVQDIEGRWVRSALRPNRLMSESGSTVDQSLVVRLLAIGYILCSTIIARKSPLTQITPGLMVNDQWLSVV